MLEATKTANEIENSSKTSKTTGVSKIMFKPLFPQTVVLLTVSRQHFYCSLFTFVLLFSMKGRFYVIFLFLLENSDYGYSLEPPRQRRF